MKLVFKYLKPFALLVAIALVFLFCQALTDLSLPTLMSDIVNVGIAKNGVDETTPEQISKNGYTLLGFFMTEADQQIFAAGYQAKTDDRGDYYQLTETDKEKQSELGDVYSRSTLAYLNFVKEYKKQMEDANPGLTEQPDGKNDLSMNLGDVKVEELYVMIPQLQQMPREAFEASITAAQNADSMLPEQIGTSFIQLFYKERGVDLAKIQKSYIINKGLEMLAVAFIGVVAAVVVGFLSAKIGAGIGRKLRRDVFAKVESFSNAEFDQFSTASLITRTTNDVQQVQMLITMGIRLLCYAPILGIGGIIMALNKSVSLSWVIAVAVAILLGMILIVFALALPKFKALQKLVDRLNLVSRENLSGMMVIRAFGNESHEEQRFDKANQDLTATNKFIQRVMAFMMPFMMLIMNLVSIGVIWFGAHAIAESTLQIGDMMAFIQYAMQIIMAFLMIAMMFIMVPRASVSAARINEVLNTELVILDPEASKVKAGGQIDTNRVTVEFKDVSFRYSNAESDVLEQINLTAKPGQTTAFIGSTGSGKSTIINLIPRFYDVTGGSITFNGVDIRNIPQEELRKAIGYVPQKGVLFSGDIDSNIRYGKENASLEEIQKAIEVAQAEEFVAGTEHGLETPIAQGGGNVSGGQKQRLSIARALVKNPPVYIFDDSFSALDFRTDAALRKALKEYTADATVFIVAQRVSTIMNAEQIIVLDEGKIVGIGTHKELLESCETYKEIAESQLAKEELA